MTSVEAVQTGRLWTSTAKAEPATGAAVAFQNRYQVSGTAVEWRTGGAGVVVRSPQRPYSSRGVFPPMGLVQLQLQRPGGGPRVGTTGPVSLCSTADGLILFFLFLKRQIYAGRQSASDRTRRSDPSEPLPSPRPVVPLRLARCATETGKFSCPGLVFLSFFPRRLPLALGLFDRITAHRNAHPATRFE